MAAKDNISVLNELNKAPQRVGPPAAGWSRAYRAREKARLTRERRRNTPPTPSRYSKI